MAFDYKDPMAWLAGGGTALGIAGNLYGILNSQSAYSDMLAAAKKQQAQAQAQQAQAIQWAQQREAMMQAEANAPLDINAYFSPMQQAQIDALRRESLARTAGVMSPDLAARTFQTETLPRMIQAQWVQAAQLAQADRQRRLEALGFMPSANIRAGNLNPGGAGVMGAYSQGGGVGAGAMGGDVSALGKYMQWQKMREDQQAASATAANSPANQWFRKMLDKESVPPVDTLPLTGASAYDPHRDRLGSKPYMGESGVDTNFLMGGGGGYQ